MYLEINRTATDGDLSLVDPPWMWLLVRDHDASIRPPQAEGGSFRDSEGLLEHDRKHYPSIHIV
jgi:hypothetical protein